MYKNKKKINQIKLNKMKAGKIWGKTEMIHKNGVLEFHRIDFTMVKPGKFHQFEGVEDGVAFELYWAEFNHDDIQRRTAGKKS